LKGDRNMYTAKVYLTKEVTGYNLHNGCDENRHHVWDATFHCNFIDTNDLKEKLVDYLSNVSFINRKDFLEYVSNEIENNRFDYCQTENSDGFLIELTEENPDGYIADYTFSINKVYVEAAYQF
jgi:hypothetical protein